MNNGFLSFPKVILPVSLLVFLLALWIFMKVEKNLSVIDEKPSEEIFTPMVSDEPTPFCKSLREVAVQKIVKKAAAGFRSAVIVNKVHGYGGENLGPEESKKCLMSFLQKEGLSVTVEEIQETLPYVNFPYIIMVVEWEKGIQPFAVKAE